jgi:hypothetical protein
MLTTFFAAALALAVSFGAITTVHHGTHAGPPAATTFCTNGGGTITGGGPLPGC